MVKKVITSKSSKGEILEAYEGLLEEVRALNENNSAKKQEKQKALETVEKAKGANTGDIIQQTTNLKVIINQSLDELTRQLVMERDKLSTLQEAIKIETKHLEEIYNIVVNANSLETLILAQKRKQEEFEREISRQREVFDEEMYRKKEVWKKEQEDYEANKKEAEEKLKRERKRSEEEHEYQLKLKQQKEADQYEARKAALERELAEKRQSVERELYEREAAIIVQEKELQELKEASKNFSEQLHKKIEEAKTEVQKELERRYKYERDIHAKEVEGQLLLNKQTISSLEEKLKERQSAINEMLKQVNNAQLQAQELAKKVVEGAASSRSFTNLSEGKEEHHYKTTK